MKSQDNFQIMKHITLIILLFFFFLSAFAKDSFRVVFYNVENLFDCQHDNGKNDTEFTPDGKKKWTQYRYKQKLNNIAKTLIAVAEWEDLGLIGLCEVENENVMNDLTKVSLLKKEKFNYVMTESPDNRGIDVALLYKRDLFKLIETNSIRVTFRNKKQKTRDILHVTGLTQSKDTLDVFVCHFPSRSGGQKATEGRRNFVATVLKQHVDKIMRLRKKPNVLIMGDFNDFPNNASMYHILNAQPLPKKNKKKKKKSNISSDTLYNLFYAHMEEGKGSYKYKGSWNMLDQIVVSGNLLNTNNKLHISPNSAKIFYEDFLLQKDGNNGKKPFRTYLGDQYNGGFSDHLPIFMDVKYK